jgi:lipoprotein NlpI
MPLNSVNFPGGDNIHTDIMALPNVHRILVAAVAALIAIGPGCRGQDANVAQAKAICDNGLARVAQGDYETAIGFFTKAIELDPKNPLVFSARGSARINTGELDEAIADHTKAIELDPTRRAPYINRGVAKVDKGDLEGAIADYSKAIALDTKGTASGSALLNRGNARQLKGDSAGAQSDYEKAVQLAKDDGAYPRFALFVLKSRLKNGQAAGELASALKDWKPGWKKSLGLFLSGELPENALLELAIQGDSKTVREHKCEAFYYAGVVRLLKGDVVGGRGLFEKCVATQLHSFSEFQFASAELKQSRS